MAAKNAITAVVVLALLGAILAGVSYLPANDKAAPAAGTGLQGRWTMKAELDGQEYSIRLQFQLTGKDWKGTLTHKPDQDHELFDIKIDGAKISFECKPDGAQLSFDGELKGDTATGSVELLKKQGGIVEGKWSMSRRR